MMTLCYTCWSIWILLHTIHIITGEDDPCSPDVYRRLPNLESRYDYYITYGRSENQDSALVTGWYYTGSLTILNHAPNDNWACGTKYPIWQEDPQPTLAVNEEKDLELCYFTFHKDCVAVRDGRRYIKIKLCPGNVYVYRLVATIPHSAYCFGEGKEGTASTFTPTINSVEYDMQQLVDDTGRRPYHYTEVYFICKFDPSTTEELWYRVYWYQNGISLYATGFRKVADDIGLTLTEPLFVEKGFKLGNEISCVVQSFNVEEGPPGPRSERSQPFNAGIQVLTERLRFVFGEQDISKRTIRLKRTLPIGCVAEDRCRIELLATIPDGVNAKQCSILTLQGRRCGIEIHSDDTLDEEIIIIVEAADVGQYIETEIYNEVHLKVADTRNNKIWGNYALDPVKVHMTPPGVKLSSGARCDANNDPHMRTFDLLYYELQPRYDHEKGVYTLYHNERFDTWVFIQVTPCWSAYCNCGVAAIAGQDVFYIDYCDGAVAIDYKSCGDKVLEVKSYTELKYEIYFPYGTYVQVDILKWRETLIGVHVQPSIYDEGTTSGLCGSLDGNPGNDFTDKSGTIVSRDQFLESWWVNPQEAGKNVFDRNFDLTVLKAMTINVCICKEGLNDGQALRDEVSCNKNAVASCRRGKNTSNDMCTSIQGRKRRSVERSPKIPKVNVKPFGFRHKRQSGTWTRETARAFCTEYMQDSPVYAPCEQVQNARPAGAIDDCVEDIMLSSGTEWAQFSLETMRSTCTSEFSRNVSLWTSEYNTPSIAETIERMACVNNCSQQGLCNEGECECYDPYVGSDCSVDKQIPPEMHGLLDDGLCDERDMPCTDAHFFAHPLIDSSTLTCHISTYSIRLTGLKEHISNHTVAAEFRTITEGLCPLAEIYQQRDFVHLLNVAVSYDGVHASNEEHLYAFDSTCQTADVIDGEVKFSLTDQFCFIEGECVAHEQPNMLDNCSICNVTVSLESWSPNINIADCVSTSAGPVFTSTDEASAVPTFKSTASDDSTSISSTPGSHGQTTLRTTISGVSHSSSPKSTTVSNTIPTGAIATQTETKATDSINSNTANSSTKGTLSTGNVNTRTPHRGNSSEQPESTFALTSNANSPAPFTVKKSTSNTVASTMSNSSLSTKAETTRTPLSTAAVSPTQSVESTHSNTSIQTTKRSSSTKENRSPSMPESTSTSTFPESTRTAVPSANSSHSTKTSITQSTVGQSSSSNATTPTQSSKLIQSFTAFKTTKSFSSTKENGDSQKPTSTHNGINSSHTTSETASLPKSTNNAGSSAKAANSTQSIYPGSTAPSTDESWPAQSENNLWIIGAIVPSVIILVMSFVIGMLYCVKKSNKQIRIESTTDLQVDQLTRLSRQNTSTSLGDVTWNNYHPPPKPDVSFEQSRRISQNFTRYK